MAYTTIKKPGDYFNNKIYTGNSGTQALTGVGFQPDMTWIKRRGSAEDHALFDAVRGVTKRITPSRDYAESTDAQGLTAFGTDGFTVGSSDAVNGSDNYASWNWKANGQGSSNTDGSINTTYTSVNTTAGFSISSYTGDNNGGATIGHGLGVIPSMVIVKKLSSTRDWMVKHKDLTSNYNLALNKTDAQWQPSSNGWISDLTSNQTISFSIGSSDIDNVNQGGQTFIAYCFAEKTGYSKFGSYVGNGNANGAFVYTGFKPAFILQKRTNSASTGWGMFDSTRSPTNVSQNMILANSNAVEDTSAAGAIDFLSNGFKWRTADGWFNGGGDPHIFMAFAEEPLIGDNPATAR